MKNEQRAEKIELLLTQLDDVIYELRECNRTGDAENCLEGASGLLAAAALILRKEKNKSRLENALGQVASSLKKIRVYKK